MCPVSAEKEMKRARDLLSCPALGPNHKTTPSQLPLPKELLFKDAVHSRQMATSLFGCGATAALLKTDILTSIH